MDFILQDFPEGLLVAEASSSACVSMERELAYGTEGMGSGKTIKSNQKQMWCKDVFLSTECMNSELLEELMSSEGKAKFLLLSQFQEWLREKAKKEIRAVYIHCVVNIANKGAAPCIAPVKEHITR